MNNIFKNYYSVLYVALLLLTGCARSMNPDIERGTDHSYLEGYQNVRISALGFLNLKDETVIQVTTEVVYGSLTFNVIDGAKVAQVALSMTFVNQESGESQTIQREFRVDSEREMFEISEELFTYTEEVIVDHGTYSVVVSIRDELSDTEFIRRTDAYVPDPFASDVNLTAVRLSGKTLGMADTPFSPLTTYNIKSSLDSLKFDFQVTNNDSEDLLIINSRLIRYDADLNPADPMSDRNPTSSNLEYKGIDYREYSVVDENRRILEQPGSVLIEFKYSILPQGNYRFEVRTTDQQQEEHFKARDFAIRGNHFPTFQTARELAEPLIYLMNSGQHEELMSIEDPAELKEAMDRFWLENIGNMRRARLVINLFYDRVEKATKNFTNFKEGWKTDRGKIYILFGAPWYIDKMQNSLRWSYTFNTGDPLYNFIFTRTRAPNEFYPFQHYLLKRKTAYHNLEYRQKQLWLTGAIIERNL